MRTANYRCQECGWQDEFAFDYTPPAIHTHTHLEPEMDSEMRRTSCMGALRRVWTPPHTGRGSSGEPPR